MTERPVTSSPWMLAVIRTRIGPGSRPWTRMIGQSLAVAGRQGGELEPAVDEFARCGDDVAERK